MIIKRKTSIYGLGFSGLALLLAGCAAIPDLGEAPQPRADLVAAGDAPAPDSAFPQSEWWRRYGDEQLDALIEEGLQRSPSLSEAAARVRAAEALAQKTGAALWPSLEGEGSYNKLRQSYNNGIDPAFVPHGFRDSTSATLNFSYELDFWGKNSDALSAAISDADAARLQAEQSRLILTTSVAAAYADLAQLYAELDTATKSADVRMQTVNLFRQRFAQGLENESSVEQAKANLATSEAEIEALNENIALTKNRLAALIGATPSRAESIARPDVGAIVGQGLPALMPADLIGRRPDVQALRMRVESAARRIDVARAGFYPSVNLTGYLGHQSLSLDTFTDYGSLIGAFGPAVHLPLFEGGKLQGAYRGARADYDAAVAAYEGGILQALRETADAAASQRALAKRQARIKDALDASERAYRVAQNRYKGGLATYMEVLRAEDSLLQARRAMADIDARGFVIDVALVKALGGGFLNQTNDKNED